MSDRIRRLTNQLDGPIPGSQCLHQTRAGRDSDLADRLECGLGRVRCRVAVEELCGAGEPGSQPSEGWPPLTVPSCAIHSVANRLLSGLLATHTIVALSHPRVNLSGGLKDVASGSLSLYVSEYRAGPKLSKGTQPLSRHGADYARRGLSH